MSRLLLGLSTFALVLLAGGARADAPSGWYTINGAGPTATVQDNVTGLLWQRVPVTTFTSWQSAATYCQNNTAGLTPSGGWRLPSLTELQTLVDDTRFNPAIDPTAFPGTGNSNYWSSTVRADDSTRAWYVLFDSGVTNDGAKTATLYFRCVH